MAEFNCKKCGLCCATIGKSITIARELIMPDELMAEYASFPHSFDEKGRCEMLLQDNTCKVYDNRPTLCNIKKTREKYVPSMSEEEFFALNESVCDKMIKNDSRVNNKDC